MRRSSASRARNQDFAARLRHRAWHIGAQGRRRLLSVSTLAALLGSLALASASPPAQACGATPSEMYPLLPASGQRDVPLNAALVVGLSIEGEVVLELVKAEGDVPVPLEDPSCDRTFCVARPQSPLEPESLYRYRGARSDYPAGDWVEFTTGGSLDETPPAADQVALTVLATSTVDQHNCGQATRVTLDVDARGFGEPVTVVAANAVPTFQSPPIVVLEAGQTTATLTGVPECFTPLLIDAAGHQTELEELCPTSSALGCSIGARRSTERGSLLAVLGATAAALAWSRRRLSLRTRAK